MIAPRRTWLSVATTAGVFAFIVIAVMLGTYLSPVGDDPFDSAEWRGLKAESAARPTDQQVAERLRTLDLDLRRTYFRQQERLRWGGTLLLAGLAIFLVAMKRANKRAMPEPEPPPAPIPEAERNRKESHARWAVTITGLLLGAGAIFLWLDAPEAIALAGTPGEAPVADADRGPPTLEELESNWPFFRGPDGSGIAAGSSAPLTWDGEAGTNIVWKTPIPLPGVNSPVVWKERVFLTGADARKEEVYCLDVATGAMLWKKALVVVGRRGEPPDPMDDTGYAAPTAATDGRYVFVMFASGRVAAFDFDGRQVWLKSFGPLDNVYGHSSSLITYKDLVLLQIDQGYVADKLSKLVALDVHTGKPVWERSRAVDTSWASPIIIHPDSGPQVVLSATPFVAAYDPATGNELWRAEVMYGEVGPSPIHRDGVVYATQEDVGTYAVVINGKGDVTATHVLWEMADSAPNAVSPVCDSERVYILTTDGALTCLRAASGEVVWEQYLDGEYYSSPSLVGNVIHLTDMSGVTTVIKAGDTYEELGKNRLGEGVCASMAFPPGLVLLRGKSHLYAIGEAD